MDSCSSKKIRSPHKQPQQHQNYHHHSQVPAVRRLSVEDEDNLSNTSQSSGTHEDANQVSAQPISVRDMIKRYNSAARTDGSQNSSRRGPTSTTLAASKSSYFGVNKFGSQTNVKQFVTQVKEEQPPQQQQQEQQQQQLKSAALTAISGYHNNNNNNNNTTTNGSSNSVSMNNSNSNSNNSCISSNSCTNNNMNSNCPKKPSDNFQCRSRCNSANDSDKVFIYDHTPPSNKSATMEDNEMQSNPSLLNTVCSRERNNLVSTVESIEEANFQPMESSYQSKTTIAKTASGVRIIIDIFFDQEQHKISATDVVGSRVETDIPQSRILNEFQQQVASAQLAHH